MLTNVLNTTWRVIMEIFRGIDIKLKNEKTPRERIMWWIVIAAVVALVLLYIVREIGSFITHMINRTDGTIPTQQKP